MEPSLDHVSLCKEGIPLPRDVKKTAANVSGIESTYNQCYRAIDDAKENRYMNSIQSYELIIPYLKKIKENDNNALVDWRRDSDNCITNFFVCPGCSNDNLIQVRPVISLDAAHLKS